MAFVAVLLAATSAVASCSGGGTVIRTVVPATIAVPPTGVGEVDRIDQAAADDDVITLAELTGYSRVACSAQPPSPAKVGDPPKCAADQSDGTIVEALPVTGCDGGWTQPPDAADSYRDAIAGTSRAVVAIYVPAPPSSPFEASLHVQYVAVLRVRGEDGAMRNVALHITGGRVTWVETACPPTADLAAPGRVQTFLITPTADLAPGATTQP